MFKAGKNYLALVLLHIFAKISRTNFMGPAYVYSSKKLLANAQKNSTAPD